MSKGLKLDPPMLDHHKWLSQVLGAYQMCLTFAYQPWELTLKFEFKIIAQYQNMEGCSLGLVKFGHVVQIHTPTLPLLPQ